MTLEPERVPPSPRPRPTGPYVATDRSTYLRELAGRLLNHKLNRVIGRVAKVEVGYAAEILYALADQIEEEGDGTVTT